MAKTITKAFSNANFWGSIIMVSGFMDKVRLNIHGLTCRMFRLPMSMTEMIAFLSKSVLLILPVPISAKLSVSNNFEEFFILVKKMAFTLSRIMAHFAQRLVKLMPKL